MVLGSGGVTGVAWETGVLAALSAGGIGLDRAALLVGTSAGAVVGAQLAAGEPIERLFERQLTPPDGELPARIGPAVLLRWGWALARHRDPVRARARIGRYALAARTVDESVRRAVIAGRLPVDRWPAGPALRVTAVDAESGRFVVFGADSGVSLVDAVAASCAVPMVWPAMSVRGRRFVDGGVRSAANADLADGHDPVLVVAPLGIGLAAQVRRLRRSARVVALRPDRAARAAIGRNVLDPARRAAAARAGWAQGVAARAEVAAIWGGRSG
ncbi:patatin-like phospholipase family protein [Plantactinospora siamensis]|uniref:Patatin-like phospholipase family protein n=1 Tax=Plantactinospora siamensis TaxID=555372 RepID=A0ABV6P0M4_9ACTN